MILSKRLGRQRRGGKYTNDRTMLRRTFQIEEHQSLIKYTFVWSPALCKYISTHVALVYSCANSHEYILFVPAREGMDAHPQKY